MYFTLASVLLYFEGFKLALFNVKWKKNILFCTFCLLLLSFFVHSFTFLPRDLPRI